MAEIRQRKDNSTKSSTSPSSTSSSTTSSTSPSSTSPVSSIPSSSKPTRPPQSKPLKDGSANFLLALLFVLLVLLLIVILGSLYLIYFPKSYNTATNVEVLNQHSSYWDPDLPKTQDLKMNVRVSLSDIYHGREVEVSRNKQVLCPSCSGSGAKTPSDLHICSSCAGKGYRDVIQRMGFMEFHAQQMCTACGGKGKSIKEKCPQCNGGGVVKQMDKIKIPIRRGIPEGYTLVIPHGADQLPDHAPGDLYLEIHSISDTTTNLKRSKNHLHYNLSISLLESLIGFKKQIAHFGEDIILERDQITSPFEVILLESKGMPIFEGDTTAQFGNLYVHIEVKFPQRLSESEKNEIRKLLKKEEETNTH